jgi:hypothetical protein
MSIRDEINARIAEDRLFLLGLAVPGDPVMRTIVMAEEIRALIEGPWGRAALRRRAGRLRADLEEFVKGETIVACLEPFKAGSAYMGRLAPPTDGAWDIRSRDPTPALRVVGMFAEADVFVALRWAPRSKRPAWTSKASLGDRDSREWRDIIVQCKTDWTNLFHTYRPVTGGNIHAHISANVILV